MFHGTLGALVRLLPQSEYSHIALVLPIAAIFIYLGRASGFQELSTAVSFGVTVIGTVALVSTLLHLRIIPEIIAYELSISVGLLVTLWIGAFCLCFGMPAGRKLRFALLFLYLLVPLPEPVVARIIASLQHASADIASVLYSIAGVPVLRSGQVFVMTNEQIEVAKECSGIRSSVVLLITGLVISHVSLRTNWGRVFVVAAIVPLAVLKNGVRIFVLSTLANYVDPRFLSGPLHHNGGIVFFSFTLALLSMLLLAIRKLETVSPNVVAGLFRAICGVRFRQPVPPSRIRMHDIGLSPPTARSKGKEDELRKSVLSLFVLVTIIAIPPPAARANSVVNWSVGGWVLNTSTSAGTGSSYWNGLQVQFDGGSFLFGAASSNLWTFSASNSLILGTGPSSWNSTLGLTFVMLPYNTPFTVDVFQFENGLLLAAETTQLTWNGRTWSALSAPGLSPTSVSEPTTWALLGLGVVTCSLLRKKLS